MRFVFVLVVSVLLYSHTSQAVKSLKTVLLKSSIGTTCEVCVIPSRPYLGTRDPPKIMLKVGIQHN